MCAVGRCIPPHQPSALWLPRYHSLCDLTLVARRFRACAHSRGSGGSCIIFFGPPEAELLGRGGGSGGELTRETGTDFALRKSSIALSRHSSTLRFLMCLATSEVSRRRLDSFSTNRLCASSFFVFTHACCSFKRSIGPRAPPQPGNAVSGSTGSGKATRLRCPFAEFRPSASIADDKPVVGGPFFGDP